MVEREAYLREVTCDLPRRERDDPCADVVAEVPAVGVSTLSQARGWCRWRRQINKA